MLMAVQIAVIDVIAIAYALRAFSLYRAGHPIPRSRLCFAGAGFAVVLAAMLALRDPGREFLYWRTAERLLLGDLGGLLLALGITPAMLAPLARTPLRHLRRLTLPPVALALWIANLIVWQWPGIFDLVMRHDSFDFVSEALIVVLGVNMWQALLQPALGGRTRMGQPARIAYVLIGRAMGIALACVGIWSPEVYYPYFLRTDTAASTSPLADQGIAGSIMLGEMALIAIVLLLWMRASVARTVPPTRLAAAENERAQTGSALVMDAQG